MKQHIIFAVDQLTRIYVTTKQNYVYPIKQTWKIYKTHLQDISS